MGVWGWMVIVAVTSLIVRCYWYWWNKTDIRPIFGVYRQPGRWFYFKYIVFRIILQVRQWQERSKRDVDEDGRPTRKSLKVMDQAQPLSTDPDAFDAVFFIATNKAGYYFIMGSERRQHSIVNGLCYLLIPGKGLLCSRKIPDTILFGANGEEFGAEGILMRPIKALHHWRVEFKGKMFLLADPTQEFEVSLDADWKSDLPVFNYDTDLHPATVARSIAKEEWTKEYFNNLKEAHQTHYEQMGTMSGKVQIYEVDEGVPPEIHSLQMQAFRDHSYGVKRDWDLMHRYAFHMFFLEDGTSASIGVICQPCTCSTLETGFVCTPDGKVHAVEWCDLQLYQHGENGKPPTDHSFRFKAGPTTYNVQVNVEQQSIHYVGWKWEARMVERFVRYMVNGVPGRGVSEFHYHNTGGRQVDVTENDPQWFAQLKRK